MTPYTWFQDLVSKLMLGNDFSGGARADSPAITVSHAITNLAAATMGELHQLGPLSPALTVKWGKVSPKPRCGVWGVG